MPSPDSHHLTLGPVHIDLRLLRLAAVLAFLVYGFEMFHFTLSIDEEVHTFLSDAWGSWIAQGRWGMALITAVLPRISALPFISTLLFCAGLAIAATLIAPLVTRDGPERAFFAALLVVSPVWPHLVEFNSLSFGIGIGMVATALAVIALYRSGRRSLVVSALLLAFAIAVYQAFSLAFLVVALLSAASMPRTESEKTPSRTLWSRAARIGVVLAGGAALYAIVNATAQRVVHADRYIDVFINWRDFLVDFRSASSRTLGVIGRILGGTHRMYLGWGLGFQVLGVAGLVGLGIDVVRAREAQPAGRAATVAAFVAAALVAVVPQIVGAGYAPLRTLIAVPLLFAAVATRSLRISWVRWPQWALLGFTAMAGAWISVSLFYSDAIARKRDELTAALLAERIDQVARPPFAGRIPFVMVGYLAPPENPPVRRVEVFGTSFFEHDFGNPFRVAYYMRIVGFPYLDPQPITAIIANVHEVEAMPSWPAPGSVAVVDGKLVAKFGPPSPPQKQAIAAALAQTATRPGATAR